MRLYAVVVAASLAGGCCVICPEHCAPAYCEGKTLRTCSLEGNDAGRSAVWKSTPCSGACVTDKTNGAFCAESATPIPECQKAGNICYHGAAATCLDGYLETSQPCSAACAVAQGSAFCALTSGPVAECQQDGAACYQGAVSTCRAGYVESSMACGSGTTCAAAGSCGPICALATTADARCPAPSGSDQTSSYCDGNTQVNCQCGYGVVRLDCGANFCIAIGGESACALSSMPDPRCGSPARPMSAFCVSNTLYSCWNGYVVATQACGATGACFADPNGALGGSGCSYKSM
jgi:hypothetical protein